MTPQNKSELSMMIVNDAGEGGGSRVGVLGLWREVSTGRGVGVYRGTFLGKAEVDKGTWTRGSSIGSAGEGGKESVVDSRTWTVVMASVP